MKHRHIFVRPAKPDDAQMFFDWSRENPDNGFDPEVAKYPSTFVLCAYDQEGPVAFQPVQQCFMLDAFAARPGVTKLQTASAMKELVQATVTQAHIKGVGEIYFLGTEAGTNAMAGNHIFEELPYRIFRCKTADLER